MTPGDVHVVELSYFEEEIGNRFPSRDQLPLMVVVGWNGSVGRAEGAEGGGGERAGKAKARWCGAVRMELGRVGWDGIGCGAVVSPTKHA